MAHHDKIAHGVGQAGVRLLDHDLRKPGQEVQRSNEDIDPALTWRNVDYTYHPRDAQGAWDHANAVAQAHATRALRANMIVIGAEVVHQPDNWAEVSGGEDGLAFFERIALPFLRERYGRDDPDEGQLYNEVAAVVHRDEAGADHLHYKYVPIARDGRLSHKAVNGRTDLATFHRDLQRFADEIDGGRYAGLHLYDPDRAAKRTAAKTMPEYKAAREATKAAEREMREAERQAAEAQARLESVQRAVRDAEARGRGLEAERDALAEARGASLGANVRGALARGGAEGGAEELERRVDRARAEAQARRTAVADAGREVRAAQAAAEVLGRETRTAHRRAGRSARLVRRAWRGLTALARAVGRVPAHVERGMRAWAWRLGLGAADRARQARRHAAAATTYDDYPALPAEPWAGAMETADRARDAARAAVPMDDAEVRAWVRGEGGRDGWQR